MTPVPSVEDQFKATDDVDAQIHRALDEEPNVVPPHVQQAFNERMTSEPTDEQLEKYHAAMRELEEQNIAKARALCAIKIHIIPSLDTDPGIWNSVRDRIMDDVSAVLSMFGIASQISVVDDEPEYRVQDQIGTVEHFPGEYPATDSQGMYRSSKYPGRAG
jgi:hypothetical protein